MIAKLSEPSGDPGALLAKRPRLIRGMFSSIARSYDLLNRLLSFCLDLRWRRLAVELSSARPGQRILDICCGTGDLSIAFARHIRAGQVIALDFSREMLSLASPKARRRPIQLVEGDALSLPFRDGSFDVVAVAFGLRNFNALHKALAEMVRVVRDGGKVVVLELSRPSRPILGALHSVYVRLLLPSIARTVSRNGTAAYKYLALSVIGFSSDALSAEMRRCGIEDVSLHPLTGGAACIWVGAKAPQDRAPHERGPTRC